jgi:predicted kinase
VIDAPAPVIVVSGPSGAGKSTVSKLLAAAFERSVHLQADAFMFSIVSGWVDPWLPDADSQNHVVGGAVAAAAFAFAEGGYTVLLDGTFFPEGVNGLAEWGARRRVPVHYAVLRPDYETCLSRVRQGRPGAPENIDAFGLLHSRYADLGPYELHVVATTGSADDIAEGVLVAFRSGALAVAP